METKKCKIFTFIAVVAILASVCYAASDPQTNANTRDIASLGIDVTSKLAKKVDKAHFATYSANRQAEAGSKLQASVFNNFTGNKVPYSGAKTGVDLNAQHLVNIAHLGIGANSTPDILGRFIGDNGSLSRVSMRGYSNDNLGSAFRVSKYRGTYLSPSTVLTNDSLGRFEFAGYSALSADGIASSYIDSYATENWTTLHNGSGLRFYTTATGSLGPLLALTLNQDKSASFASTVSASGFVGNLTGNASGLSSTLVTGSGGTGTSTTLTQGSVVYAGASGIYTQDANNFFYNPTGGPSSSPTLQLGPRASNPLDAEFEFYTATTGINVAHFHNTGVQSSTGGAIISLNAVPIGAAISSGSRLGSFQFGGAQDTSQTLGVGATMGSVATENWSSSAHGSSIDFKTIPNGSTTRTLALTLNQDQSATFANTVSGTSFNSITALASSTSPMDGSATVGTSTTVARQDHVHPSDTSKAATNQTMYIGTTSHAINRASASEALTGISSIDGSAATLTTPRAINGVNFNGSAAITINAVDSTARVAQSQTINSVAYGSGNIQTSTANTSDYTTGTWTPTFNNLTVVNGTGGVTYAGRYTAIGNVVYFTVTITPSGTATTASTNNSTSFDPPVGTITARGNVTATSNFIENFGVGSIYSGSAVYTPTWAATNHLVFISGFYFR